MNRRVFLKLIGCVMAGLAGIGRLFATIEKKAKISLIDLKALSRGMKPIVMDGKEYYVMLLHPTQAYRLRVLAARDKWKQENHERRWEKRYGSPYPNVDGEAGSFEGVRFVA